MKNNNLLSSLFLVLIIFGMMGACNQDYAPRPKEYPAIELPAHTYQMYNGGLCPFTFEYHSIAQIERDSEIAQWKPETDCWMNIVYPKYNATIYLSYKPIVGEYTLESLRNDAHRLTYEHAVRADFIEPKVIETQNQVFGLIYNVGGDAASATQFFVTDTSKHWLRGALYFHSSPNADSLAPVIHYIDEDILHMIGTLHWAN